MNLFYLQNFRNYHTDLIKPNKTENKWDYQVSKIFLQNL